MKGIWAKDNMTPTEALLKKLPKKYHERVSQLDLIDEDELKFHLWLNDGWVFEDGSHISAEDTISEAVKDVMYSTYPEDEMVSFNG